VSEATDALNRGDVTKSCIALSEDVERAHAGTHEGCRVDRRERRWNPGQGVRRSDHVLGVPSIDVDPGDLLVPAIDVLASVARFAVKTVGSMPSDAHAVALFPSRY
jgi:hypothetical protein